VGGGGHCGFGETGGHELKPRHLRGRVLHGNAIGTQIGVRHTAVKPCGFGVIKVVDEDFLGQRERSAEFRTAPGQAFVEGAIDLVDKLNGGFGKYRHGGLRFLSLR